MSRGALYIVWRGDVDPEPLLERSIASLAQFHPELPYKVIRLNDSAPGEIEPRRLLDKAAMLDLTPFDETMFLDADTVVMDRLDYAFDKAVQFGLACCICECPWARRYPSLSGDAVEYNAGVLWFTKKAKPVFDRWQELSRTIDSSIRFRAGDEIRQMPYNDQAGFALAIEQTGFNPFALPLNFNFRPIWQKTWFGPIKVFHDYSEVPESLKEWNRSQIGADAIIDFARASK